MAKIPSTNYHEATIIIRAGTTFPVDMLRYDSCFPSRSDDVSSLAETLSEECRAEARKNARGERIGNTGPAAIRITVSRTTPHKTNAVWTIERWRSFGAVCKPTCACCRHQWIEPKPDSVIVPEPERRYSKRAGVVEPICRRCERPGSQCACEPAGDFA
jgi:hypothetical protein